MSRHNSPAEDWTEGPILELSFARYWASINPMPDASSAKEARGGLKNAVDQLGGLRDESGNPYDQVSMDDYQVFQHWQAASEAFALEGGDAVSPDTPTSLFNDSTEVNSTEVNGPDRLVNPELDPHPDNIATVAGQQDEGSDTFDPIPDPGAPYFRLSFSGFFEGGLTDVPTALSAHDQVHVSLPDDHIREIAAEALNRAHNDTSPYDSAASESDHGLPDRPTSPLGERGLLDSSLGRPANLSARLGFPAAQASVEQKRAVVTDAVDQSSDSYVSPDCSPGDDIDAVGVAYLGRPSGLAATRTFQPDVEVAALTGKDDDSALDKIPRQCPSGLLKRGTKRIAGPLDMLGETGHEHEEASPHKKQNLGRASGAAARTIGPGSAEYGQVDLPPVHYDLPVTDARKRSS